MAPSKRKTTEEQADPQGQEKSKRVTRSMSRQPDGKSPELAQPPNKEKENPRAKGKGKGKGKANAQVEQESVEKVEKGGDGAEATTEDSTVAHGGSHNKTIVVEHCKQCNSFKTRAFQVRDGLQKGVPGITVLLNPEKPRRGCFEIREEGGEKFISLLDMKRPFKPMKDLDMEQVIADIIDKIK